MEAKELTGKVSLVTGASRGLGRSIALELATLGSRVAVNYLSGDAAAASLAEEIRNKGVEVLLVKANVADANEVNAMTREIVDQWEKLGLNKADFSSGNVIAFLKHIQH